MYCLKCGKELSGNENFCRSCGAKVNTVGNSTGSNHSADGIRDRLMQIGNNCVSGAADIGKNKTLLLANIALLLISFIFALTDTFKVEAILDLHETGSMFGEEGGLKFFAVVAYLLSVFCILIPLLFKKTWKPIFFLPAKIVTIAITGWFFLFYFIGLNEVKSSPYSSMAEFTLTTAGWIFIISTLAAMVLSFKLSLEFKKQMPTVANKPRH